MRAFVIISVLIVVLFSCGGDSKLDVDVSEVNIEVNVSRFDQELFNADVYKLKELNAEWLKKYGIIYESFVSQMIKEGLPQDPMIVYRLERFLTDSIINTIGDELKTEFKDFTSYETELKEAFSYYTYYFPDSVVPNIVTFYSNFNAKTFPYRDTLGIGLDMFIGRNNKVTELLPPDIFPQYIKNDMDSEYLVSEAMKSWIYYKHSQPGEYRNNSLFALREDFLSSIIYHGKMMLLLDAVMPNKSLATKFEYTEEEIKWCEKNEKFLYQNLIEFKLIYSKNFKEMSSYINPGSFTPGLPQLSPGGVGKWIGYKMVKQYYEGTGVSLTELIKNQKDARKILSYYKP